LEQIDAIEHNRLAFLGNYGFARAMVYTYIRFLEADERVAMSLFNLMWPSEKEANFTPKTPIKEKKMLISTNFIWLITIIIIVIILGTIIWISYSRGYLKRPFDSVHKAKDSIRTETPIDPKIEKQDTLRVKMLQIAQESMKKKEANHQKAPVAKSKKLKAVPDTTDYTNDLIFRGKDSPFNQRF
jgi:cytoskeletal protein RodZ